MFLLRAWRLPQSGERRVWLFCFEKRSWEFRLPNNACRSAAPERVVKSHARKNPEFAFDCGDDRQSTEHSG
jgi:hypothetical protein